MAERAAWAPHWEAADRATDETVPLGSLRRAPDGTTWRLSALLPPGVIRDGPGYVIAEPEAGGQGSTSMYPWRLGLRLRPVRGHPAAPPPAAGDLAALRSRLAGLADQHSAHVEATERWMEAVEDALAKVGRLVEELRRERT